MIDATTAIRMARALIGTAYSELDCINLIKKVIRTAPGGDKNYTTAGTNALWDSYDKTGKYRDLIWRQAGISRTWLRYMVKRGKRPDFPLSRPACVAVNPPRAKPILNK